MSAERSFFAMPYPGIFRITLDLIIPGLKHVHVYLLEGRDGGLVVIDTGLGTAGDWERVEQGVAWLGRDMTAIEKIVLTHAHPDHMGMSKRLQDASGAPVVCHPIAERIFRAMQDPSGWFLAMQKMAEHGFEAPEDAPGTRWRIPLPDRFEHVREGETLFMGGSDWEIHWTPGHEWGHVVFFRPSDRVLISGDTVLLKITPHIGYHEEPPDPLGMFFDSLGKVARMDPVLVVPGHGRSFEDGAGRANAIRAHHRQRLRRIREILMRKGPITGAEVSREMFGRDLMFFAERLALAETLAHLEYLRLRDVVSRERHGSLWLYDAPRDIVG